MRTDVRLGPIVRVPPAAAYGSLLPKAVGQRQRTAISYWDITGEYLYGGNLATDITAKPVALGGHGDLVGHFNDSGVLFFGTYFGKSF